MQKLPKDYGIMYMYREYVLPIAFPPSAQTSVVCVNDLGLTLCVSMKLCKFILYRVKECKCKNKYIYTLLCNCVR
jgi:hypothetical protein